VTAVRIAIFALVAVGVLLLGVRIYYEYVANPRVSRELLEEPDGERAKRVMLLTLPDGRRLPVNYLRKGGMVYAAADGRWWKPLAGDGADVTVLVRGETLSGRARAVRDDPDYTTRIFRELRPDAIEGFGTLVEIRLSE